MAGNNKKPKNGAGRNGSKQNGNGNGSNGNGNRQANQGRRRQLGRVNAQNVQLGVMSAQQNTRPVVQQTQVLRGSDFLTTVTVLPSPTTTQRVLNEVFISPSFFPGTRITQMSQLWERYRFTSFRIRYVPAVPSTLACQLVVYFDTDPSDDPAGALDPDTLIRQAVAHTGAQQWNFNTAKAIPLPMRSDDQMYYTGDVKQNVRFSLQAKAYVIQITDPLNFNGEALTDDVIAGSIYIDWVCKFQLPQINPAGYALRDEFTTHVVVNSGNTVTTTPESVQLSGLKPYKNYLVYGVNPSNNPALPNGFITIQPKASVREDYLQSTNRSAVAASTIGTDFYTCVGATDGKGNIQCWLTGSGSITTTNNVTWVSRPL